MPSEDYKRSVVKAVQTHGGLYPLVNVLAELPNKVLGMTPFDVIALTGAMVNTDALQSKDTVVQATTLAFRGYDVDTSMAIWRNFQRDFPEFSPNTTRLMSRGMLHETYGMVNGDLLAAMMLDPQAQPALYSLMFNAREHFNDREIVNVVERDCASVKFRCHARVIVPGFRGSNSDPMWHGGARQLTPDDVTPWQLVDDPEPQVLPYHTAAHAYAQATDGGRLPSKIILSLPFSTLMQAK